MARANDRQNDQLRELKITRDYLPFAEGSVLIEMGKTKLICSATIEDKVPQWLKGKGQGWITAEYGMIPRSCEIRVARESRTLKVGGRTHEIQRLIGRSMRSIADLKNMDEITIWLDCDVIVADGGTRVAAICGSFIALYDAVEKLVDDGRLAFNIITDYLAAISVGIVDNEILLDMDYFEDSQAQVDFNIVQSGEGKFIEVQGTAEGYPFTQEKLIEIIEMGNIGINKIIERQREIIGIGIYERYQKNSNSNSESG